MEAIDDLFVWESRPSLKEEKRSRDEFQEAWHRAIFSAASNNYCFKKISLIFLKWPCYLIGAFYMKTLPVKPEITFSDLEKIDIRVGLIELVEDVAGSDKLVKLTVDFGEFKRTILVGMKKERENPKEIQGKQALFVVNLPAKEMFGEKSEGMMFDIGYSNNIIPVLAIPEKEVPNGVSAG